ncbi:MAG: ATP-binding protein, partial [Pyrobaculum sp.]
GLDTARGYVLARRRLPPPFTVVGEEGTVEVCRGRPSLPATTYRQPRSTPRSLGAVLAKGVYWLKPLGLLRRGREWLVAGSCKTAPPLTGWERVPVGVLEDVLSAYAEEEYWRFWPRGGVEADNHMLVVGGSKAGKTTFVKQLLQRSGRYIVVDFTERGEYLDLPATRVEGTINFAEFSVEEQVKLLTVAIAATLGRQESAVFSPVQLGALRLVAARDLASMIRRLASHPSIPEMTKQVLMSKLASLCVEIDEEGNCTPHPSLTRPFRLSSIPAVVRIRPVNDLLTAVIAHGILLQLFKRSAGEPTVIVIDEYHRIAAKAEGVEDPVELMIRQGRHRDWYVTISTQNPLDLKRSLVDIVPTFVALTLYGEAAEYAAKVLNVPVHVVESLATGQWLARGRQGMRRWPDSRLQSSPLHSS